VVEHLIVFESLLNHAVDFQSTVVAGTAGQKRENKSRQQSLMPY
jgi:hypothetical protein